ncbi:hypothetical protein FBFR_05455 [Flavobacterium fryxellicola]|uniref:Uncharacterized protein n=1 Tax=Flavobacterium fryxellicola TaxID=249352 RepID=A0A167Y0X8_9FLAO|nr:hypothetical protein FBFR_05455 [Flavobacterium fryxellicola]
MILQTGGSALGEISTKSNSNWSANLKASDSLKTPGSIFSPTSLTSCTPRIRLFILCASFFSTRGW